MPDSLSAQILAARAQMHTGQSRLALGNIVVVLALVLAAGWITPLFTDTQPWRSIVPAIIVLAGLAPIGLALRTAGRRLAQHLAWLTDERERALESEASRQDFDAKIADALDMADTEGEALRVVERAFASVLPGQHVELLLADNSHAHLERKASTAPDDERAGCPVAAPFDCPAARRARVHEFTDPHALNACPKLAGRMAAGDVAVCLPVSVLGKAAGVIHTIGPADIDAGSTVIAQFGSIARQVGGRMAMLRVLAETQLQASTDSLTGLLNRRAFENSWQKARRSTSRFTVAMADLDHFKALNDTYGHDTGDRALRLFADVLRATVRQHDLVSRRGGEEFAVCFPGCDAAAAVAGLQRVQHQLRTTQAAAGLPSFSASFGVVESTPDEELDSLLTRADVALFAAKRAGRDRVVVHDHSGHEQLYPATAFPEPAGLQDAGPAELPASR